MSGCFDFILGDFDFTSAESYFEADDHKGKLDFYPAGGENIFECVNEIGKWQLNVVKKSPFCVEIYSSLIPSNKYKRIVFRQLTLPPILCDHIITSGPKMGGCTSHKLPITDECAFVSYYTLGISRKNKTLLITHPLKQEHFATARGVIRKDKITDFSVESEVTFFSGNVIEFPMIRLSYGNGIEMLTTYADEQIEVKKDFSKPPVRGWNSWDYYRWTITEDEVLKNAEFIAKDKVLSKYVKRIIIDDGWQYCYGEWEPNHLFKSGMKNLAAELKKMDLIPGLWLAPSIIEPHCRIAQLEYDMLAQSADGQPTLVFECMKRHGFVLDPTVKKAQMFLRELFEKCCAWGYEYFKLDFLGRTLDAPRFADQSVPRGEIIRKLMTPIVEAVNNRAVIMGCNYTFSAGNSFVSATRIGGDIHSDWHNIRTNTVSVAFRYWMNKKLWLNDPDFALCRGVDTTEHPDTLKPVLVYVEPNSKYNEFFDKTFSSTTLNEQQILLSIALMAGGAINLSDNLPLLNESGLDLARKVVSARSGDAAIPLDLFESELPYFWLQKLSEDGSRLLIVNWDNETKEFNIPENVFKLMPGKIKDFWSGKYITKDCSAKLLPHCCILFEW